MRRLEDARLARKDVIERVDWVGAVVGPVRRRRLTLLCRLEARAGHPTSSPVAHIAAIPPR